MIVTLATQIIFRGISEIVLVSGGSISASNTDGFRAIGGKIGNVPYILFLVVILSVIFAVILGKSTFGRRVYAIGTNRLTAYYSGVHFVFLPWKYSFLFATAPLLQESSHLRY